MVMMLFLLSNLSRIPDIRQTTESSALDFCIRRNLKSLVLIDVFWQIVGVSTHCNYPHSSDFSAMFSSECGECNVTCLM